jgi:putative addiction module antidote
MAVLRLVQIGNSLGVVLPKELLARLKLAKGDTIFVSDAPGGVLLSPYDPEFERHATTLRAIARRRRNALRELAG